MSPEITKAYNELSFLPDLFAVGGCVRDSVLGVAINDIDFATSATPGQVTQMCQSNDLTVIPTGLDHGTVTVKTETDSYEVTTFRRDVSTDGRRATVAWADTIEEDLSRRDFTINAIAWNPAGFIDPFGGIQHLTVDKMLHTVGNPAERFAEDYLRVVRGARFAARFDLGVEHETNIAMRVCGLGVSNIVSMERITDEFNKAFEQCGTPSRFLSLMSQTMVLSTYLPEIEALEGLQQNPIHHPEGDVWVHTLEVVDRAPVHLRWHALFHDVGKKTAAVVHPDGYNTFGKHAQIGADMIQEICARIKLPGDLADEIELFTLLHMRQLDLSDVLDKPKRFASKRRHFQAKILKYAKRRNQTMCDVLESLMQLCHADSSGRRDPRSWDLFIPQDDIEPVVTGKDLIMAGHKPGPKIGELLTRLHKHQLTTGQLNKEELLRHAKP